MSECSVCSCEKRRVGKIESKKDSAVLRLSVSRNIAFSPEQTERTEQRFKINHLSPNNTALCQEQTEQYPNLVDKHLNIDTITIPTNQTKEHLNMAKRNWDEQDHDWKMMHFRVPRYVYKELALLAVERDEQVGRTMCEVLRMYAERRIKARGESPT